MSKAKILLQFDTDAHASSFDAVVAVDAGVEQLVPYAHVGEPDVQSLVHGAMFTRGPEDLRRTAIFIGGSDVASAERLLARVTECFFGPLRVSVLMDASGANTTAAAAVLSAARHAPLADAHAVVLGATGPVGQRAVRLLAGRSARVRVASRRQDRAEGVCQAVRRSVPDAKLEAVETSNSEQVKQALDGATVLIAAGAAGVELVAREMLEACRELAVAIDLNAVPPVGIGGVQAADKAARIGGAVCYGALGVGGLKMKIHKAAIRQLFEANDQVLDAEQVLAIGQSLEA